MTVTCDIYYDSVTPSAKLKEGNKKTKLLKKKRKYHKNCIFF